LIDAEDVCDITVGWGGERTDSLTARLFTSLEAIETSQFWANIGIAADIFAGCLLSFAKGEKEGISSRVNEMAGVGEIKFSI
jgi:hypothetical protein